MSKARVRLFVQVLIVDFIAAIFVAVAGGFGNWRTPTDYANGLLFTGAAVMALGFLFWKGGIEPRDTDGTPIDYTVLGVKEGTEILMQQRANAYKTVNFCFIAGLLPIGIGAIIAIFFR